MQAYKVHYNLGVEPVTGAGLEISENELNEALNGPVSEIVFDESGSEEIDALLGSIAETEFAHNELSTLLKNDNEPEDWRVGEALAEYYLKDNKNCLFPWPVSRDERKRRSSLPGADLIGIQDDGYVCRFAFGEVKTSAQNSYPPSIMYGRHGLRQQIEDLRDRREIRDDLVKYLAYRAINSTWQDVYRRAFSTYLHDNCNVRIFGILVRDVTPNIDDLRARVQQLSRDCPPTLVIEIIALYLPLGRISSLSIQVMGTRIKGDSR